MERLYKCHCFPADFTYSVELGTSGENFYYKENTCSHEVVFLDIAFDLTEKGLKKV